jgi:hypothetical protein
VTPVADTDPATALPAKVKLVAGHYDIVARAEGYGLRRFRLDAVAGKTGTATIAMAPNWASKHRGSTVTGDGTNLSNLIDDTESSDWTATSDTNVDESNPQAVVDLGGGRRLLTGITLSAMLNGGQGRFTALRQFRIETCDSSTGIDCDDPAAFEPLYTSPPDAFAGGVPRPLAPDLIFKYFDVPDRRATHLRLVVLDNQCTGGPDYQGEQDNDPSNSTDCPTASSEGQEVNAAELQVFPAGGGGAVTLKVRGDKRVPRKAHPRR